MKSACRSLQPLRLARRIGEARLCPSLFLNITLISLFVSHWESSLSFWKIKVAVFLVLADVDVDWRFLVFRLLELDVLRCFDRKWYTFICCIYIKNFTSYFLSNFKNIFWLSTRLCEICRCTSPSIPGNTSTNAPEVSQTFNSSFDNITTANCSTPSQGPGVVLNKDTRSSSSFKSRTTGFLHQTVTTDLGDTLQASVWQFWSANQSTNTTIMMKALKLAYVIRT